MAPPTSQSRLNSQLPELGMREDERLAGVYERLRDRLLDLTNRNQLVSARVSPERRSRRHLFLVNTALDDVLAALRADEVGPLAIHPLPDPDILLADERTEAFLAEFAHARETDPDYLEEIQRLSIDAREDDAARANADEALRLRLRAMLGMPPRRKREDLERVQFAAEHGIAGEAELPLSAPQRLPVRATALRFGDELDDFLDRLDDVTRITVQETGLSTLSLAFGFLERPDPEEPGKRHRAPLLLMPVRLQKTKIGARATLGLVAQGAPETNLSLKRLMERDFRRGLPVYELGDNEDVGTIAGYFEGVARAIEGLNDWRILPWLVLGSFSFGRNQMFLDLAAENWSTAPVHHSLVRAILAGTDIPGGERDFAAKSDYEVDAPEFAGVVPHLIAEADSSQHSALIDAAEGHNLVIEGPPGTGKSQTITNLIGHALGAGKRVLFLSEKQAALDVVRRRLDQAGLGDFCLDIHSERATPHAIVDKLRDRADLGWGRPKAQAPATDPALLEARHTLNRYLDQLHDLREDGETPFRLIWQVIEGMRGRENQFEALKRLAPGGEWIEDPDQRQAMERVVELYAMAAIEFEARHGPVGASPWSRTGLNDIPQYEHLRLRAALSEWREPMVEAMAMVREGEDYGIRTLADLSHLVTELANLGPIAGEPYLAGLAGEEVSAAGRVLELMTEASKLEARLAATPDLVLAPRSATVRAAELVSSRFGEALADRVPIDLERAIRLRVTDTAELIFALEGLIPAIDALGLDREQAADRFGDVARLARALSAMAPARRQQLLSFRTISEADLIAAKARIGDLREAADAWKRHFPALDPSILPDAADVRAAATFIRRGGLSRLLGGLNPDGRATRALIERLTGRKSGVPIAADLLEGLAGFIDYAQVFETDGRMSRLLGPEWRGLKTDFSGIEAALRLRQAFVAAVAQASHRASRDDPAEALIASVFDLDDAAIAELIASASAAERFLAIPPEVRLRLQPFSIGSAIAHLQAEIRAAAALQDIALDSVLASLEHPIGVIADYHRSRERLADLKREMLNLPRAPEIAAIVGAGDPADALAGLLWIEAIGKTGLSEETKRALTGKRAGEAWHVLTRMADRAISTLARLEVIRTETEATFGWLNLDEGEPAALVARIDSLIATHGQLGDYLVLRRLKLDILSDGVGPFLDAAERLMLPMAELLDVFRTLIAFRRAERACRNPALREASGIELDVRRKIFAERDRVRIRRDGQAIRDRLFELKTIPGNNRGPKAQWSEMALLHNEFQKQGRYLPVRALLSRAPRSIQALAPCFLMSPIALAKFAPPDKLSFDLVIIDEASQMRPEDALGGLLRAKQLVVVGDAKQLPPNDVFQRADRPSSDADEDDIIEESILEVCARTFGTVRRLKWHYRSRCESLIAFSNREFYRDSLVTFPSARPDSFSIDLVRVDGTVRNRRNIDEAARIAEEAVRFMRHFAEGGEGPYPTLGLVTVNQDQRNQIFEEVRCLSAGDDLVERYRQDVEARGEPFFVKNIENVQGDERDFIFASLVRGPQRPGGPVMQIFGALGGRNGHRRLNVLITRARRRMMLFTSFGSAEVVPTDLSSPGIHALKRYLAYVEERGRIAAHEVGGEPESPFEEAVSAALADAGFVVDVQVGVAQYRIDLAVRNPDQPERYLAGIECDGAQYHAAGSARDRDRLREEVLRGLGWELLRVWSTDWFADPQGELRRLVRRLDLLRAVPERGRVEYRVFDVPKPETAKPKGPVATQLSLDLGGEAEIVEETPGGFEEAPALYDAGGDLVSDDTVFGIGRWDEMRLRAALVQFRETEIRTAFPKVSPQRSILRDAMIDCFIRNYIIHPDEWERKVPAYLRRNTSEAEVRHFLKEICGLVARLG